jgi:hypothetical protein
VSAGIDFLPPSENEGEHVEGGAGGSKVLSSVHTFVSTRIKCAVCTLRFHWMCDIDENKLVCMFTTIQGRVKGSIVFLD